MASYEQARAIRERLVRENPSVTRVPGDLAMSYYNIGILQRATGRLAEALASHEQAPRSGIGWFATIRRSRSSSATWPRATTTSDCCSVTDGPARGGDGLVRAGPRDLGAAGARESVGHRSSEAAWPRVYINIAIHAARDVPAGGGAWRRTSRPARSSSDWRARTHRSPSSRATWARA